jgi:hypothetical protein
MLPALLLIAALLAGLAWLILGGRGDSHEPTAHRKVNEDIDCAELEQAERDVRDADDEDSVRDWGPGAGKPRPPHLL